MKKYMNLSRMLCRLSVLGMRKPDNRSSLRNYQKSLHHDDTSSVCSSAPEACGSSKLSFPASFRLSSACSYIPLVNTNPSLLTFLIIAPIQDLSSSLRIQFAHHRSMLLFRYDSSSSWCSLCSLRRCNRNPALRRSKPNSERLLRIREMRR